MALLLAAGVVGAGAMHLLMSVEDQKRSLDELRQDVSKYQPESATFQPRSSTVGLAHSGQVQRSMPDTDLRGVNFWWVDYGGGSWSKTYTPPGVTSTAAMNY